MRRSAVTIVLLCLACSPELPSLPTGADDGPARLEWVSLATWDGGQFLDRSAIPAGVVARLQLKVSTATGAPSFGASVRVIAESNDFEERLTFPRGDACFSDNEGLCSLVLKSTGLAGPVTLSAQVAGANPFVERYEAAVVSGDEDGRIRFTLGGLGGAEWAGERSDPLAALDPMVLSADASEARLVEVHLTDSFGNPLVGRELRLELASEESDLSAADAGVAADAGALDASRVPSDVGRDATPRADVAPVADADAATGSDAGAQPRPNTARRVLILTSDGVDCSQTRAPDRPGTAVTDGTGSVRFCLEAGADRGEWRLQLTVNSLIEEPLEPHGQRAFQLRGRTVAGQPARIVPLVASTPVLCQPGRFSPSVRFAVENDQGEGVPGVRVLFDAAGGLDGLSRQMGLTDNDGVVSVQAACPARLLPGGKIIARVESPPLEPTEVAIEVRADSVARLEITPDASNPNPVRTGTGLRFTVVAYDASDVPVLHPTGGNGALQLRLTLASEGHAGTLRLPGDEALGGQVLSVDASGALDLDLTVRSQATPAGPILLAVRTLDGEVEGTHPIRVHAGEPAALAIAPAGRLQALVGGTAGALTVRVLDGPDPLTANGVPNVPVELTVPAELQVDRLLGRTDAFGRFTSQILLVDRVGDHEVVASARLGEWTAEQRLIVEGTVGQSLFLRVLQGDAPVALGGEADEQQAHQLTLRAGTALQNPLTFRLENEVGGGVPGLGLSIDLVEGAEADCALWEAAGTSGEDGRIIYGPNEEQRDLQAGPRLARCLYRVHHGNAQASALVRIVQIAGLPTDDDDASLTVVGGLQPPLANRALAPAIWDETTAARIRLAARDANGNPAVDLRMWVEVQNCWVSGRVFTLDDNGEAELYATTGTDPDRPCTLTARYGNPLAGYEAPVLNLSSAGYDAPQLFGLMEDPIGFIMARGETQVWRLDEINAVGDARLPNGEACEDFSRCSSAQIVELGSANEAGVRPVVRLLSDEVPLRLFQDGEDHYFEVEVPHTSMGAGGWLGLRLVANRVEGEALRWSEPVPFFAQPPFDWVGPGPGGTGGQVQILGPVDGEANRTIAIRGGHRIQLDEDEALEMVVCGQDNRGKVFAVVHLDPDGSLPDEPVVAQRSHLFEGRNLGAGSNLRAEDACRLADLNGDGHLDLVMPGRTDSGIVSAGYPNVAIHHGLGGGEFGPAQRVVWVELRLRDRALRAFEVSTEPLAIIACAASSLEVLDDRACSERYRLPLERDGLGWRIEVNSFDRLQPDDEEPLLSAVIPAPDLAVAGHGFVRTEDGVLSTLSIREDRRLPGDDDVRSLAFEAGSQRLALSRSRPGMELWDLASDEPPLRWVIEGNDVVYDVAFQPGGDLVAANHGSSLFLWNLETGEQDIIRGLFPSSLVSLAFHPEGDRLVGAAGQRVRIIDVVGQESLHVIDHEEVRVRAVAFHPDGRQIASLDQNGVIRLWDPETGEILDSFAGTGAAEDLGYSPNGQLLAVVGENDVALWGLEAGRLVRRLVGHSHITRTLSFHRGGTLLATGAQDSRLRLWDVHTGEELWGVQAHRNTVSAVAFSPSNDLLAAGSQDDSVKLWNLKRRTDIPLGDLHDGIGVPLAHPERAEPWTWIASFEGDQLKLQRPVSWRSGCGNGVVQDGELFDRGQEWFQDEYRTQCGATCGDGIRQQGEACDDGNDNDADECPSTCQAHRCGDGLIRQDLEAGAEGYESCDDGNMDPWDGCGACNRCGDDLLGPFESCDDGNDVGGDGCTDCALETCGNGIVDEGEICDDGNDDPDDNCQRCVMTTCSGLPDGSPSGFYPVSTPGRNSAYCDMVTAGGGWTLVGVYGDDTIPGDGPLLFGASVFGSLENSPPNPSRARHEVNSYSLDARGLWETGNREILLFEGGNEDVWIRMQIPGDCNWFDDEACQDTGPFLVLNELGNQVSSNAYACVRTRPIDQHSEGIKIMEGQPGTVTGYDCARGSSNAFGGLGRIWYPSVRSDTRQLRIHESWDQANGTGYVFVR